MNSTILLEAKEKGLSIKGRYLELPYPDCHPSQIAWQDERLIVLYWTKSAKFTNRNVMAYDFDGNTLWQVPNNARIDDGSNAFVSLDQDENSGLVTALKTWGETYYFLDVATGAITPMKGIGRLDP